MQSCQKARKFGPRPKFVLFAQNGPNFLLELTICFSLTGELGQEMRELWLVMYKVIDDNGIRETELWVGWGCQFEH